MNTDKARTVLWHYTTLESLYHIAKSRSLLGTHFRKLNDTTEYNTGYWSATSALQKCQNSWVQEYAKPERIADFQLPPEFVICLSAVENSLSMWRAYGGATNSNEGVAIGFDLNDLRALGKQVGAVGPIDCEYDDKSFIDRLAKLPNERSDAATKNLEVEFGMHVIGRKHHDFAEEREFRIVFDNLKNTEAINSYGEKSRSELRPHFPLSRQSNQIGPSKTDFDLGICRLMAGPKTAKSRLEMYSRLIPKCGKLRPKIEESGIPYR